jgi:hypothetical protein
VARAGEARIIRRIPSFPNPVACPPPPAASSLDGTALNNDAKTLVLFSLSEGGQKTPGIVPA